MPEVLHLSSLAGSSLLDSAGEHLGRVRDVVVRLDLGDGLPPVIGLQARIAGRDMFVPAARIERLGPTATRTATTKLNLAQFERRPGELLLSCDVLDRSLINVSTARLVTAREVELVHEGGAWRVSGIDPSFRARQRRLPILNLLPPAKQRKIRSLLGHNPSTAGGLMNPDFISVRGEATVAHAMERVRASEPDPLIVCVVDEAGVLAGAVTLAQLIR